MITSEKIQQPARGWPVTFLGAALLAVLSWSWGSGFVPIAGAFAAEEKQATQTGSSAETKSPGQDSEDTEKPAEGEQTETTDSEKTGEAEQETAMQEAPEDENSVAEESDRPVEEDPPEEEVKRKPPAPPVVPEKKTSAKKNKHVIGATAVMMEKKSELLFRARVDSGAKSCSLHIEKMIIENESEKMADNIGKLVRFKVQNGKDSTWLTEKIAGYVIIKTSDSRERRYKVPLTLRWKKVEKKVLVTLNNRKKMEYPLLLGRNFLRGDFLIDVEMDNDD